VQVVQLVLAVLELPHLSLELRLPMRAAVVAEEMGRLVVQAAQAVVVQVQMALALALRVQQTLEAVAVVAVTTHLHLALVALA
jgi:hypothetical protein